MYILCNQSFNFVPPTYVPDDVLMALFSYSQHTINSDLAILNSSIIYLLIDFNETAFSQIEKADRYVNKSYRTTYSLKAGVRRNEEMTISDWSKEISFVLPFEFQ